jgi:hypothetical protein
MPGFDPELWVRHLERFEVEYILVGGLATNLYGATRPTIDIDVVPRWEVGNLARLCDALRDASAVSASGPPAQTDEVTPELLIEREVTTWNTDLGRIDVLVGIPDADGMPVDFDALEPRSLRLRINDTDIRVASLADVIVSKEFASRAKDRRALPELHEIERSRRLEPGAN